MRATEDDMLRAAVGDLAGEARGVPDLADRALRRGRQLRRRRRGTAVVGAFVALTGLTAPFLLLRPGPPAGTAAWNDPVVPVVSVAPAPTGDWTRSRLPLPGGWVLAGATSTGTPAETAYALDRTRNRYLAVDTYEQVWAPPQGRTAVVVDEDRRGSTGLLDIATGSVRWVDTGSSILDPHWSPDGQRLVVTILDKDTAQFSMGVLTARTGTYQTFPVDIASRYLCTDYCFFTWTRDGQEVVLQQTDPGAPRSESAPHPRRGVQLFSPDTGQPTRFLPVPGDPAGPWSWSPDGQLVVIKGRDGPQIAEVATGQVLGAAPAEHAAWVSDDRLLYRDLQANEMVLADRDGRDLARQALPRELGANMVLTISPD
ncbi:hypothetical protein [Micromonospora endolithica]|uniref:WD40 repeat domain-containing protein n=1 Tax=Micromonospora endolithica TaxID=230091 RepID=A0A3A9ZDE0_9ACTN|nr:hypothetical protein [Micromonospora endolithica]RKN46320.1 hypothetical protein D7223_15500 [Micromonospora endolithica]TWJ24946.1 hypothetical protein JD76_05106 [Micromonospora endolithica]